MEGMEAMRRLSKAEKNPGVVQVRCSAEMVVTSRKWIRDMRIGFGGWGVRIKPWRGNWHKPGRTSVSWG